MTVEPAVVAVPTGPTELSVRLPATLMTSVEAEPRATPPVAIGVTVAMAPFTIVVVKAGAVAVAAMTGAVINPAPAVDVADVIAPAARTGVMMAAAPAVGAAGGVTRGTKEPR